MKNGREYFLTTPRIGFSLWSREDTALARQLWGDHRVTEFLCASGRFSEAEIAGRLEREIQNQIEHQVQYWPVYCLDTAAFAGCCGLRPYDRKQNIYELGFHLRPEYWGRGFGSEAARAVIEYAFDTLKVSDLFAGHHPHNKASAKMLIKLGFHYTGDEYYEATGLDHPSYRYHV